MKIIHNNDVKVILTTVDGRMGVFWIGADEECEWDSDGDDETESVAFQYFGADSNECIDSCVIDGDDWRELESTGSDLHDVLKWVRHGVGMKQAVRAAIDMADPDGWSDGDEQVSTLQAENDELRTKLSQIKASIEEESYMPIVAHAWMMRAKELNLTHGTQKYDGQMHAFMQGALQALFTVGVMSCDRTAQLSFIAATGRMHDFVVNQANRLQPEEVAA